MTDTNELWSRQSKEQASLPIVRSLTVSTMLILSMAAMSGRSLAATPHSDSINEFFAYIESTIHVGTKGTDIGEHRAHQRCRDFTARYLEMDAMARTAAAAIWSRMSVQQRAAYRSAFDARMLATCLRAIREFRGKKLTLLGVRSTAAGEKLMVTRVGGESEEGRMVVWRLRDRESRLRAVDIILDGRSTVSTAREDYAAALEISNGDIDAFIQSIRQ